MEKRTPHYPLARVKALVQQGRYRVTRTALFCSARGTRLRRAAFAENAAAWEKGRLRRQTHAVRVPCGRSEAPFTSMMQPLVSPSTHVVIPNECEESLPPGAAKPVASETPGFLTLVRNDTRGGTWGYRTLVWRVLAVRSHALWQDVYRPEVLGTQAYVKVQIVDEITVVISFKKLEDE